MKNNTLYSRFLKYTMISPHGCLIWTGKIHQIPILRHKNKTINVRKYIFSLTFPYKIIDGQIKHKCGNKKCVNPHHLMNRGEFFNSLIFTNPTNGCWEWQGNFKNGYGYFMSNKTEKAVHRIIYEQYNEKIPKGYMVCHSCDNTKCINPAHLFIGMQVDNMKDMLNKNRANKAKGENHHRAKITEEQVKIIKKKYNQGLNMKEIQKLLNISYRTIQHICSGTSWKHVII